MKTGSAVQFEGRIAVVTGGASGLGRAVVGELRSGGAEVAIFDASDEAGRRAAAETGAMFVQCDVADRHSWQDASAKVAERLGPPTMIHLNAGTMTRPPSASIDDDPFLWIDRGGYRRVMTVNTDGVVFGLEAMAPYLAQAGGGHVVVTASTAGVSPLPFDPFYSMSKHAVVGLVRSIAPWLAAKGITINALCPGGVTTPLVPSDIIQAAPALMTPGEVADVVLRLFALETTGEIWVKAGSAEAEYRIDPPAI